MSKGKEGYLEEEVRGEEEYEGDEGGVSDGVMRCDGGACDRENRGGGWDRQVQCGGPRVRRYGTYERSACLPRGSLAVGALEMMCRDQDPGPGGELPRPWAGRWAGGEADKK